MTVIFLCRLRCLLSHPALHYLLPWKMYFWSCNSPAWQGDKWMLGKSLVCLNSHPTTKTVVLSLHFAWGVAEAKCIVAMAVCICVCVCLFVAAFPRYCTDPDVTWGNGKRCHLVVHYWTDLQSMHGFHCYDNIAPNAKCQLLLVHALCLVCSLIVAVD